jgi:hypothetical protein
VTRPPATLTTPGQVQHGLAVAGEARVLAGERAVLDGVERDVAPSGEQGVKADPFGIYQGAGREAVVDGHPGQVPGGQPAPYHGFRSRIRRNGPGIPRRDGRGLDRAR